MNVIQCEKCLQIWSTRATKAFNVHECIGVSKPTYDDLLKFLDCRVDQYGCYVPINEKAFKPVGYKGKYLTLRSYTIRVLEIDETYIHRIVWRMTHDLKAIPDGMSIAHECAPSLRYENSHCCNADHLVLRTHKQNHAYMNPDTRRKISIAGANAIKSKFASGELNGPSEAQKRQISESLRKYHATHERTDAQKQQWNKARKQRQK